MTQELENDVVFTYTALGEPIFLIISEDFFTGSVKPRAWSITQLKTVIKYMEENPKCSLMSDGSGNIVKL